VTVYWSEPPEKPERPEVGTNGTTIEEGRAASKSPHKKFGYFLSISQQEVSADITRSVRLLVVSLVSLMTHPPRPHTVCTHYSLSRYFAEKFQLGPANRRQKLGLVWRNRKKISQIINDYLCLPFFLFIILWGLPN
jgi:hypothetical protein